jgi:hypothetical protein
MTRLVALYPRSWRDRYEDEFLAMMEERPPDALDPVDIIRGALDARLHARRGPVADGPGDGPLPYNGLWSTGRAGAVTLAGGFIWLATIVIALNGPIISDDGGAYRDGSAAWPSFIASLVLLGSGIWAVAATVPSSSRVARTAALVAGLAGTLWALGPWILMAGVVMCAGVAILAVGAARTGRWRVSDAVAIVGAIVVAWSTVMLPIGLGGGLVAFDGFVVCLALLSTMWFVVAHALLRPARPMVRLAAPPTT